MRALTLLIVGGLLAAVVPVAPAGAAAPDRGVAGAAVPTAVNGPAVTRTLRAGVEALPVRPERRAGYTRSKFTLWVDADHDCQDTRSEVLRQESRSRVRGACAVRTGRWVSQYDGVTTRTARSFDIDHLVPLAEAWDSGARAWSPARREAYANDLADRRSLIAVSATSNRSKGDRDPTAWMPARGKCLYVLQWVVVKTRWGLSVDRAEKRVLRSLASSCPDRSFTTHVAQVRTS